MRTHTRRASLLGLGGAALAGTVLGACGGQTAGPTTGATAAPSKRPVTLIVDNDWTQGDRYKVVTAWLERANRVHPHIKTELRDNAESQDKTIALFAAGDQGDLFQLDQHMVPVYGPKGVLQDISSTLASLKFDLNSVYDVENITHWEGKRHGLLIQLNTHSGVYHKTAFLEAGVKEPTPDWTWDDYLDTAIKLHRPQENRWGTQGLSPGYFYTWFWSADVPYMDAKGTKTSWDSPAARPILQWLADLVLRYRVAPSPAEAAELKLNFNQGHYVLTELTVPTPAITRAIDGKFQWEVLPRPKHPQTKKAVSLTTGHNYLVTTRARERGVLTEAVQVLVELYDKEIQELYISGLNLSSLPILKSVATSPKALEQLPPGYKTFALDSIASSKNYDKVIGFSDFHSAVGREFTNALNGEVTVEQAAVNMTRAGDAALQQAAR
ncbi:MAG TPA: hypothetical protein VHS99_16405 [Chloroflexota bacterium]|jgi:multiple sugar transport system substrate-binding protein|nr:hypothetical protein [Chloroflexota bacterium]